MDNRKNILVRREFLYEQAEHRHQMMLKRKKEKRIREAKKIIASILFFFAIISVILMLTISQDQSINMVWKGFITCAVYAALFFKLALLVNPEREKEEEND